MLRVRGGRLPAELGAGPGGRRAARPAGRRAAARRPLRLPRRGGLHGLHGVDQGFSSSIALANTDTSSPLNVIYTQTHQSVPLQPDDLPALQLPARAGRPGGARRSRSGGWRRTDALEPDPAVFEVRRDPRRLRPRAGRRRSPTAGGPVDPQRHRLPRRRCLLRAQRLRAEHRLDGHAVHDPRGAAALDADPVHPGFTSAAKTAGRCCCSTRCTAASSACSATPRARGPTPLQTVIATAIVSGATVHTLPF